MNPQLPRLLRVRPSGHAAAAPPSSVKSRRPMWIAM